MSATPATTGEAALSQYQAFEIQTLSRSQLKEASYNPRQKLSRHKRQKLEKNLRTVGLIGPVIWNKRTGNVLGGHQRLAALDALEAGQDYLLDVSVVDLDPSVEKPQNVFLNNPLVQGTWDMQLLGEILREDPAGVAATGFDPMDVQVMFDDAKLAPLFNAQSSQDVMQDIARIGAVRPERDLPDEEGVRPIIGKERQRAVLEAEGDELLADDDADRHVDTCRDSLCRGCYDDMGEPGDELPADDDDYEAGALSDGAADTNEEEEGWEGASPTAQAEREKWQKIKAEQKERMATRQQEDDTEYYAVVGFANPAQRKELCVKLGIEPRAAFADGGRVMSKLRRRES